ncbi:MAG: glycosyltransferase family 39 protein [Verrucomicrobiales bacterium]|nr:glycosyltransferase family 39 protein [Verrucomicrobiales bacterium]
MASSGQPLPPAPEPPLRLAVGLVLAAGVLLFALRLAGPADLTDNDQEGPTAYVLDILQNGHWWVQRDAHGEIASKPPLYPWLAAIASRAAGGLSRFTLYLPCALAVVGTALLLLRTGAGTFGVTAGLLAAGSLMFSQFGLKHVVLARTDAVFMGTVTLAALTAYRAWTTGRGWTGFWLAAGAASLTKGPLGLGLAAGGCLAAWWERRGGDPCPLRVRPWPGVALYALLFGGWFALAYGEVGSALTEKQVGRELVGHLSGASAGGHWPGSKPFHPLLYFLSRFAPWSVLTCLGLWRVWRRPAARLAERRFERFLFCWFAVGMVIFMVAPHKRADLLLPLLPAAALLAGRELARLLAGVRPVRIWQGAGVVGLGVLIMVPLLTRLKAESREVTAQTRAMRDLATWWRTHAPPELPLTVAGNAMTLEFYLQRHQFHVSPALAAQLLSGDAACFVAVADFADLEELRPPAQGWHELARAPAEGEPFIRLLGNRPSLAREDTMAVAVGPVSVQLTGATLVTANWLDFTFATPAGGAGGVVTLHNHAPRAVTVGVHWQGEANRAARRRVLGPGESWEVRRGDPDSVWLR